MDNELTKKLKLITNIWNDFILEEPFFQGKILYDDEVQKNYYGEIMHYMMDTFVTLFATVDDLSFNESIFRHIGLLQIMYVHQDLVDEILRIYRIEYSRGSVKKEIRDLRNELVGHPISRDKKGILKSSTFWGGNTSGGVIHYIKYQGGDFYKADNKEYEVQHLLTSHKAYLDEYFGKIMIKQRQLLKEYKIKLTQLDRIIKRNPKNISLILDRSTDVLDRVFSWSRTLSEATILYAVNQHDKGDRYNYYLEYFVTEINVAMSELNDLIDQYVNKICYMKDGKEIQVLKKTMEVPHIIIEEVEESNIKMQESSKYNMKHYYLSKIAERKYFSDLQAMKSIFDEHPLVISELENMEINYHNDNEFYISYEYLVYLTKDF